MITTVRIIAVVVGVLGATTAVSAAGEVRVTVSGVRSDSGSVRVAIYRSAEGFATRDGVYRASVIPARRGTVEVAFSNLLPGTYGVAAFHDENDNDRFDRSALGLPAEGFGFGNDAPVRLSAPSFREAAIHVDEGVVLETMTMRYW